MSSPDNSIFLPSRSWLDEHILDLSGGKLYNVPQIGHDLVVMTNSGNVNIGRVTEIILEDHSGRNFRVKTVDLSREVYVKLADGVRTYPQES